MYDSYVIMQLCMYFLQFPNPTVEPSFNNNEGLSMMIFVGILEGGDILMIIHKSIRL